MIADDMEISPDFKVRDWKALKLTSDGDDWAKAVEVFERRIRSRFIEPADILIDAHSRDNTKKVGFAVLALDFIVIETLQGFIDGEIDRETPKDLVVRFLTTSPFFMDHIRTAGFARCIYSAFRCGISHQGQTDGDFRVRAYGEMIQRRGNPPRYDITINRTEFHKAVVSALMHYCSHLLNADNSPIRNNFLKKMNHICGITA